MNKISIYTDGSCKNNGKKDAVGGWAYSVLLNGEGKFEDSGAELDTTNNKMELMAVIKGLEKITPLFHTSNCKLEIFTDSAYIHNCYANKWYENWQKNGWKNSKKEPVKNKELWEKLIPYFKNPDISFFKVKGHANNEMNNRVDYLAQSAAEALVRR
jgi:ribonuclease HI